MPRRRTKKPRKKRSIEELDRDRRPLPGAVERPTRFARYNVSAAGRVRRDDGFLLTPSYGSNGAVKININGGRQSRSLPRVVYDAFGTLHSPEDGKTWVPWVDPDGPLDEATGRLRVTVYDVVLVRHGDLIRYGQNRSKPPTDRMPIVEE